MIEGDDTQVVFEENRVDGVTEYTLAIDLLNGKVIVLIADNNEDTVALCNLITGARIEEY